MAQYINTNIASLNSQRNLNGSQSSLQTSLQRLSSGLRINGAKDDAAGLGIADRFTAQIKGLNQATRNANDGISLTQTADGALGTMTDNLQRMRELAVQAANATNTSVDRVALQAEITQLVSEIDRVATSTQFNGINLLDGTFSSSTFQVGANSGQTISVSLGSARSSVIGTGAQTSLTAVANSAALANGDVIINGVLVGASSSADDTGSSTNVAGSAIAKAAAINRVSSQTGVTAAANVNSVTGASMTPAAVGPTTIQINGVSTGSVTTTTDGSVSRGAVVAAINLISAQTGVVATDTGEDTGGVKLSAADGRTIVVSLNGFTGASTGLTAGVTYGSVSLMSNKDIVITEGSGTITNSGLRAGTYLSSLASVTASATGTATALASGDVKINGISIGASLATYDTASTASAAGSAIAKAAAVNKVTASTGVTATARTEVAGGVQAILSVAASFITINGIATDSFATVGDGAKDRAAAIAAINKISGRTGVVASDGGSTAAGIKLVAADGRNVSATSGAAAFSAAAGLTTSTITFGRVTLTSASQIKIDKGTTVNGTTNFGIDVSDYGVNKTGSAVSTVDISTVAGANTALTAIDNALAQVNSARGALGAIQNRFNATVSNLQTTAENLTASRSRIQDADFAMETAALTRAQILQQAGVAMLAQANALPNQVLTLLRG